MTLSSERFEDAFDELFPRAYGLAFRLLGTVEAAEDVAAEALARAFMRWWRLSDLAHREAWVLRVTANLAIDTLRRRPISKPSVAQAEDDQGAVDLRLTLTGALRSLPRRQRETVALRYLADLSTDDIASLLHISTGSVKVHVHRGLATLRTRLGPAFAEVP